ncbi:bacterio-opsin activator domain-containing protein [Halosolutus gelatinilyticus]|uniref:bacterio-opsin activator domain-containing protein n=1 Tax=Halosolutus gelatinilyticus TaxID=2931975 RepID=UPI001FF66BDE|nr:bacterio-opsin activator domain-containing protein [Halosolutus gelatinilyticus]
MSDGAATAVGDLPYVLVVGDTEPIDATAATLSAAFEPESVVRESTVDDALERLEESTVDCVVCGFDPPDANAESALERIRDRVPELPIVAITESAARALEAGASDVVGTDDPDPLVSSRVRNAAERYRLASTRADRRYRAVLESSIALVWVLDDDGTIDYVSAAVDDRMGYTPAELERTTFFRLVHPEDRDRARELIADAAAGPTGATATATLRVGHADGTWHVYGLTAVDRTADPTVAGIVVTVSDAGPAAGADDVFQGAIDRLEDAMFAIGPHWELRVANEAADALFVGPQPEPGTVVWELVPDSVRATFSERFREADTSGEVVRFETTYPGVDGPLEVAVHPSESGLTVRASERAADRTTADRDRLALLEGIVDSLDDGIAVLDGETIAFANPALFALTDRRTLVGGDVADLFDAELAAAIRERASAPFVRWMDPVTGTIDDGDDGRPVDVFVTPLDDDETDRDRTLCVVRDRRRSPAAAVSTLEGLISAIREAETQSTVRRAVVEAVRTFAEADVVAWYRIEDGLLRPAAVATSTAAYDGGLPSIEVDDELLETVVAPDEVGVYDREPMEPFLSRAGIRAERILSAPVADRGVVLATSTDPMAFDGLDPAPIESCATLGAIGVDLLATAARRREVDRDRSRLESIVSRIDRARELVRDLLRADTRDAVERRLAEGLVSLDAAEEGSIELAWVGDVDVGSDEVTPRTWAGRDGEFLDSLSIAVDPTADDPTGRTAATREPTFVENVDADRSGWRRLASDSGFRAALSVPLAYDDFTVGTVTVYAENGEVFDDRMQAIVEHLATVAGFAVGAIERKRALVSDSATELEVVFRDDSEPLSSIATRIGERIDVRAVVPRSSGGSTLYCTVPDADEEIVREVAAGADAIDSVRTLGDDGDEPLYELVCASETVAGMLADHGAVLRSITPVDDRVRLVIELSSTVEVRSFVGMLDRAYPGTELVARREEDRSARSARAFDVEFRDRLSERQLRTLETAYYGGFFEWPRESTGEEVASSLGVSQPTFSRHIRLAQQKLFELLFEEYLDQVDLDPG